VPALRAHGLNLTLGTDSAANNNDLGLLDELRSAALLASGLPVTRAVLGAHAAIPMSAHDWLRVATLNGARALGLADSIGSLTVGKWADLCCVDLARPHTQPLRDPAVQLVYSVSRDQVSDVWVAGRRLLAGGRPTRLDIEDLLQRTQRWHNRSAAV
jgi:5-methylthioadenosine/S-adenosylhomocysteine deaminase